MSRRPGIGRGWYDKFKSDIFPRDYAVFDGVKCRPPKFYDGIFELSDPAEYTKLKEARRVKAFKVDPSGIGECGDVRLRVKEEVKLAQLKRLNRNLEVTNDTKGVFNL
jgi:hypothetical protein